MSVYNRQKPPGQDRIVTAQSTAFSNIHTPITVRSSLIHPRLNSTRKMSQYTPALPVSFGIILFPAFQLLDVAGPLDILNVVSWSHTEITLSILSNTLDPVTNKLQMSDSTFAQSIVPTHTFSDPPANIDVLIVPGGAGTRGNRTLEIDFIRKTFPSVQYLITVCTGAALAAQAGVLAGEKATTNKNAFDWVTSRPGSETVKWKRKARWVEGKRGKIWTTSGISAGMDGVLAWVGEVYGEDVAVDTAKKLEYVRITDWENDPFALE